LRRPHCQINHIARLCGWGLPMPAAPPVPKKSQQQKGAHETLHHALDRSGTNNLDGLAYFYYYVVVLSDLILLHACMLHYAF
jgi:hypothetical protein